MLLELLVDVEQELLDLRACHHVLMVKARADAEMQGLLGFLLLRPLLEARAFAAEAKLDDFHRLWHSLAAVRDDSLHVAPLGTNESPGDLELALVRDLNVISTGELGRAVTSLPAHVTRVQLAATPL